MPYCTNCGKEIAEDAAFCPHCGARTERAPSVPPSAVAPPPIAGPRYASIGSRFAAVLIDTVILAVIGALLSIPFGIAAFLTRPFQDVLIWPAFGFLNLVLWVVYFTCFEGTSGQTFGKVVLGIRVVDQDGVARIDFGRGLVRNILRIIDLLPVFYIVGVLLMATNPRRQRLGDIVARTIVVRV